MTGSTKPVNRRTASEFHEFVRREFPSRYVFESVDGWSLVMADGECTPTALFKIKRSHQPAAEWKPYAADKFNYAAYFKLATLAGLPLFVVHYTYGAIDDDTPLHLFQFERVLPSFVFSLDEVITAREFVDRFPYPNGGD